MNDLQPSILVVDDEEVSIKRLVHIFEKENYDVSVAMNGIEAWDLLQKSPQDFDIVLLDRMMPGMDGLEVLKLMKDHSELKSVPVIIQTGMTEENEILEGIQAGAYYYLTKPYRRERLLAVVTAATNDHIRYKTLQKESLKTVEALHHLTRGDFSIQSPDEVDNLAALLAKMCPESDKVVLGLWELLINAVEHGNLGISYEEKSELLNLNIWRKEIERRVHLPEHKDKKVLVHIEKSADDITIIIEDMGPGFDWEPFLEISPDRVFDIHGRGIALAGNYSFHQLEYLGNGNKVKAKIKYNKDTE
jgi:DNA-binding response OmpR family regulator